MCMYEDVMWAVLWKCHIFIQCLSKFAVRVSFICTYTAISMSAHGQLSWWQNVMFILTSYSCKLIQNKKPNKSIVKTDFWWWPFCLKSILITAMKNLKCAALGTMKYFWKVWYNTYIYIFFDSQVLTISLLILSFSILSVSFFCSRSVLVCQVATALVSFWILPDTERWYSLKSLACWRILLRYSWKTSHKTWSINILFWQHGTKNH